MGLLKWILAPVLLSLLLFAGLGWSGARVGIVERGTTTGPGFHRRESKRKWINRDFKQDTYFFLRVLEEILRL